MSKEWNDLAESGSNFDLLVLSPSKDLALAGERETYNDVWDEDLLGFLRKVPKDRFEVLESLKLV